MLYTVTTDTDLQTIKNEIATKAKEIGFGVLKEYPFKDILKEKGHPIERDITVYELCNPVAAQEALSKHPEVSVYLPCRISLYEHDGKAILSTIGVEDILKNFDLDDAFKTHMSDVFDKLKKLLSSWDTLK
ncbi:DUF302 domain-containing protein [Sulfurimonas sp. SAG-AH-194-I05]|nr:DUF302 domain-containing protein [Sulfurimonas sp. SAG-AH-194-I05]MDF1875410.1 DUF302 domain-containing protein [Sulfurimonas sp. SAG-AH-194-I05]